MAQLRIDFQGRGKVETFSRARVQPMGDGVQLALGVARQVRALGQVLAQQPIRVLVGAALPRAVGIGKEHPDREPLGQALVLGHLFAPIVRQGFPQQRGHMPEFFGEALAGTRRIRPVHPGQDDQARRPLHQGADGRAIAGPLDEVAFPVAGHRAGGHLGGTLGNRRHIGDLAASVCPSRPRPTRLARLTQRRQQFAPQGSAGQHIQRPHRWSRSRAVFPCRQDTRVGGVRQSVRASSPQPAVSAHTATARGPGVCAVAVADGLGRPPDVCAVQAR